MTSINEVAILLVLHLRLSINPGRKTTKQLERDLSKADMFIQYTDAQLGRAVHSKKFIADYGALVSPSNPANQSSSAWVTHMVAWLKKRLQQIHQTPYTRIFR